MQLGPLGQGEVRVRPAQKVGRLQWVRGEEVFASEDRVTEDYPREGGSGFETKRRGECGGRIDRA